MAIEDVQTNLRIPSNLKERLQESADAAGRSLSAEASYRLAQGFELELVSRELQNTVEALQQQLSNALNKIDVLEVRNRADNRKAAKLEERVLALTASRDAEIAAAVKNHQRRLEWFGLKIERLEKQLGRGGEELVLDQAAQIRELRSLLAVAHIRMALAAEIIKKSAPTEIDVYEGLRETMKLTGPKMQMVIDELEAALSKQQAGEASAAGEDESSRPPLVSKRRLDLKKAAKK